MLVLFFFYKNDVLLKSLVAKPTSSKSWKRTNMEYKVGLEGMTYVLGSCAKHRLLEQLFLYSLEKAVLESNKL